MKLSKSQARLRIKRRIRKKINGTAIRPRLSIYRSNKGVYCQLIDDINSVTLVSASYQEKAIDKALNKTDQAKEVGKLLANKALDQKIESVIFDRSGYIYHGRIKALGDGAREAGLKF